MALKANPPFIAPAAPLGAGMVQVVALRDLSQTLPSGEERVVHKKGDVQNLEPAIARELLSAQPEDYAAVGDADSPEEMRLNPQTGEPVSPGADVSPINAALQPTVPPHPDVDPEAPGTVETGEGGEGETIPESGSPQAAAANPRKFEVSEIPGVGDHVGRKLEDAGYRTVAKIRKASVEDLQQVEGVGAKLAQNIKDHVTETYPEG